MEHVVFRSAMTNSVETTAAVERVEPVQLGMNVQRAELVTVFPTARTGFVGQIRDARFLAVNVRLSAMCVLTGIAVHRNALT